MTIVQYLVPDVLLLLYYPMTGMQLMPAISAGRVGLVGEDWLDNSRKNIGLWAK